MNLSMDVCCFDWDDLTSHNSWIIKVFQNKMSKSANF